jgi:hypothetical protein
LTDTQYRSGDFVWSNFPERENPARPGPRHIGYVALSTSSDHGSAIFLAYTTSRLWEGPRPFGVHSFDRQAAAAMGQSRSFTLDLRRMALVPATEEWFPDLASANRGIVGHAPERIRAELEVTTKDLARRRPELIERLGPLWPGRR